MSGQLPFSFEGYEELIRRPLEQADPRSLGILHRLLESVPTARVPAFGYLIKALTGITIAPGEADSHWKIILTHKRRLESQLGRTVNIKTAAVDYYDQRGVMVDTPRAGEIAAQNAPPSRQPAIPAPTPPSTAHIERLKEELLRARRYRHALSVVLLDVGLHDDAAAEKGREKALALVTKIINKAVRNVDFLARHAERRFLLILPNTNRREAVELAERLKNDIDKRSQRLPEFSRSLPVTFAVGQCQKDDTAAGFIRRLENLTESRRLNNASVVHTLD